VRLTDVGFWIPPIMRSGKPYEVVMPDESTRAMLTPAEVMEFVVNVCEWGQKTLTGMLLTDDMPFSHKKAITSAMRRVAPLGLATGIGMSFNLRALRWIIEQRTDPAAEEEMRYVFGLLAEDAIVRWPQVFQDVQRVPDADGSAVWYRFANSKI